MRRAIERNVSAAFAVNVKLKLVTESNVDAFMNLCLDFLDNIDNDKVFTQH